MAPMPTEMKCVLALPMGGRAVGLAFCRQRLTTAGGAVRGVCGFPPLVHFDKCTRPVLEPSAGGAVQDTVHP